MNLLKQFISEFHNISTPFKRVMVKGFHFCFLLSILSAFFLTVYLTMYSSPSVFYIGLSLFKTSTMLAAIFLVFGIAFQHIQNQIVSK